MREQACGACGGSLGQAHDHPCEARGLDRRELLKRGGLAAAALLLAACGVPGSDGTGPGLGSPVTVKLSDYPALANSGGVALVANNTVAVENNAGSYIALSMVCPHRGGQILLAGSGFQCTVHGATFDKTGSWIGGQPTSNMYRINVTNNGDGTLTVG